MEQSAASKELEQFARTVDSAYGDSITFLGRVPQINGVDEQLAQFIRDNPEATHDEVMFRYCKLAILEKD